MEQEKKQKEGEDGKEVGNIFLATILNTDKNFTQNTQILCL